MRHRRLGMVVLLLVPLCSGCFYAREIVHTRRDIERAYPQARFDREVVVRLGTGPLRGIGWIAGLVPDDDVQVARDYLRDLHRVKVGVYRTETLPPLGEVNLARLPRFEEGGWRLAVRTQEADEAVWVLYRAPHGDVRDLYVLVLDEEALVLVRLQGRLDEMLKRAVAAQGRFFSPDDFSGGDSDS